MFSIGLTGGIGSGKTVVSDRLAEHGASIIDSDRIAHALTAAGGAAMPALVQAFGQAVCDAKGALDRQAMRARVFSDPRERLRLEGILHPMIRAAVRKAAAEATGPYCVFVVPLLVESGDWRSRVDRILVVDCDEATQIERVKARSGLPVQQIGQILATQASRSQRLAVADDVLLNQDRGLDDLHHEIDSLHQRYLSLATR